MIYNIVICLYHLWQMAIVAKTISDFNLFNKNKATIDETHNKTETQKYLIGTYLHILFRTDYFYKITLKLL